MRRLFTDSENVILEHAKESCLEWIILLPVLQSGHCGKNSPDTAAAGREIVCQRQGYLKMGNRKRLSWYFLDWAFSECVAGIYTGTVVWRANHQYQSRSEYFEVQSLCLPYLWKYFSLCRISHDFMLWRYTASFRGRAGRRGASNKMRKNRRWIIYINAAPDDQRTLYFVCGVLHRRKIWVCKALPGKQYRSALFQPRAWNAVLVL